MAIAEEEEEDASALACYGEGDQFDQLSQLGYGKKRGGAGGATPVKKTRSHSVATVRSPRAHYI
jgi:hypothetical protein